MINRPIPTLKELVENQRLARFHHYKDGFLIYAVDSYFFHFPIPIEDTGGGEFKSVVKAITLMRWIRKHREELVKAEGEK